LLNLILYTVCSPEIFNRAFAAAYCTIVINYDIATHRKFRIQIDKSIHCRFIHIAIQAQYGKRLDGSCWKRILEPSFQKGNLIVQQVVLGEVLLYGFQGTSQHLLCVMRVSTGQRVLLSIRLRQSFHRICDPDLPDIYVLSFKNGTHVNSPSTSPRAGSDEITRNIVLDYVDYARVKILQW